MPNDMDLLYIYLNANKPRCIECDKPVQTVQKPRNIEGNLGYETLVACHGFIERMTMTYMQAAQLLSHLCPKADKPQFECFAKRQPGEEGQPGTL